MKTYFSDNYDVQQYIEYCSSCKIIKQNHLLELIVPEAYLILKDRSDFLSVNPDLEEVAKEKERYLIPEELNEINKDHKLSDLSTESIKELVNILVTNSCFRQYSPFNDDFSDLVFRLLNLNDGDSLCELEAYDSCFLTLVYNQAQDYEETIKFSNFYSISPSKTSADFSSLVLSIICDKNMNIETRHYDSPSSLPRNPFKYNKGFVYPATFTRLPTIDRVRSKLYPEIKFPTSQLQWVYVDQLLGGLEGDDARVVALLYEKSLSRSDKNEYLQKLLDDGWIEGIITLPRGCLEGIRAKTYLVIFSRNNDKVRFLDATKDGYYIKPYPKADYQGYINLLVSASAYLAYSSEIVDGKSTNEDVVVDDVESVKQYQTLIPEELSIYNSNNEGTLLREIVAVDIGLPQTISNFTLPALGIRTDYQILTSSDIENGQIKWDSLAYIKPEKVYRERVMIHKNDVVLTSKSTKVKVAVVEKEPEAKVLVTGGMIILRPNTTLVNPNYLKVYLESEAGQNALKSIQTGSAILHLSPMLLEDLRIPLPSLEEQNAVIDLYNSFQDQIVQKQKELDQLVDKLNKIDFVFKEGKEDGNN